LAVLWHNTTRCLLALFCLAWSCVAPAVTLLDDNFSEVGNVAVSPYFAPRVAGIQLHVTF
jgi:hypothetical protein